MPSQPTHSASAFTPQSFLWFLLVVVLVLPYNIHRSLSSKTFFVDEAYTVLLANRTFGEIVDITTFDAHPPGYYFIMKFWLKPFRMIGIEPALGITRALGVVMFIGMIALAWFGGRWLWGATCGSLAAVALAISANAINVAGDARQYSICTPLLFACWMILLITAELQRSPNRRRRTLVLSWILYTLFTTLSLWCHLLSGVVIFMLGICWLALCAARQFWKTEFFRLGAIAHAAIILLFLPWLPAVISNYQYVSAANLSWMTPATLANLARVIAFWYPYGIIAQPYGPAGILYLSLGILSFALPLFLIITALIKRRRRTKLIPAWSDAAATGVVLALMHTAILWSVDASSLAKVFHGPRYPLLAFAPYVVGLSAACCWAARRLLITEKAAWLLMLPWFLASATAHVTFENEVNANPVLWMRNDYNITPNGETVYVLPSELIPYFRNSLHGFDVRRIEDIAHVPPDVTEVTILNVNMWNGANRARDEAILTAVCLNQIASYNTNTRHPLDAPLVFVFTLHRFNHEAARQVAQLPPERVFRPYAESAASVASVYTQRRRGGWSHVLRDGGWNPYLYAIKPKTTLRFDRPLDPGNYELNLAVWRQAHPRDPEHIDLLLPGQRDYTRVEFESERNEMVLPFQVHAHVASPELTLVRNDDRMTSDPLPALNFYEAWIMPAANGTDAR